MSLKDDGYSVTTFFFLFNLRKASSPVVHVPKEPEKSTERLGKGAKSNKDLKRCIFGPPSFTLRRRNLKTEISLWKRINCLPFTLRRRNFKIPPKHLGHFAFVFEEICGREVAWLWPSFSKSSILKMLWKLFVHTKTQSGCFEIPPVGRVFSKSSVLATD